LFTDFTITIFIEFINHSLEFIITQVFTEFSGDSSQISQADSTGIILVEELESLQDFLNWVSLTDLLGHNL
jgi:hypothetical protein